MYREMLPARILSSLVHHYWVYEKAEGEHHLVEDQVYPEAWPTLGLASGDPLVPMDPPRRLAGRVWVTAGLRQPVRVTIPGHSRLVGIRFSPAGLPVLLGILASEVSGMALYEEPWALDLALRLDLGDCPTTDVGRVLDQALYARLPGLCDLCQWGAVEALLTRRAGAVELEDLVVAFGRSRRQLERSLVDGTGYSPGDWRSVYRAQVARSILFLKPEVKIVDTAAHLGYADQAHMSRSFRSWTGRSPLEYRAACRPFWGLFEEQALAYSMGREVERGTPLSAFPT